MIDLRPELGFSGQIWAILLRIGPQFPLCSKGLRPLQSRCQKEKNEKKTRNERWMRRAERRMGSKQEEI